MSIKKSKDEWAAEPVGRIERQEESSGAGKKRQRPKVPFAVRIPADLYDTMKDYLEKYARAGESINEILMSGAEAEMLKRLARAGKNMDNKTQIKNVISGIQEYLKELDRIKY